MPHYHGEENIVVVTKEELIDSSNPNLWNNYDALAKKIKRDEKRGFGMCRAKGGLGGNGRQLLVEFDSLAAVIKDQFEDPRTPKHPLAPYYKTSKVIVDFYTTFKRPNFGYLKEDEYARYITNAAVMQALVNLEKARVIERRGKGHSSKAAKDVLSVGDTLLNDSITFNDYLRKKHDLTHNLPSNPRTFSAKFRDFKSESFVTLIKDPKGTGKSGARKVCDGTVKFLNNIFGTQSDKPTATEVFRQYSSFLDGYIDVINNNTGEVISPKGFKKLSDSTVKAYLAKWENKIGNHAKRSGDRQVLTQQFVPYSKTEFPKLANSIISIDDRNPPFKYKSGQGGRVWFYIGIDIASDAMICWVSGKTKEELIINFYRELARNYHKWGVNLPFTLECESSLNSSFTDSFLREGYMFEDVNIYRNVARSKYIERRFGHLRYNLEKEREGWIARPFAKAEANQKATEKEILVPYETIVEGCLQDIVTWNNTEHRDGNGVSRWDYFINNQNPELKPTNYKSFIQDLGRYTHSSCNAGIVNLQNDTWVLGDDGKISTGENLINIMTEVEGKEMDIYWLDDHNGTPFIAMVFDKAGRYLCELKPHPVRARAKAEETQYHKDAAELMARYTSTVTTFMRTQKNLLEHVTIIDNRVKTVSNSFAIEGVNNFKKSENTVIDLGIDEDEQYEYTPIQQNESAMKRTFGL